MANCENCGNGLATVPYAAFEAQQVRHQKTVRNFIIALILSAALMFASNIAWLWYINQYDFESYEVSADGNSDASYYGNGGDVNFGGESEG